MFSHTQPLLWRCLRESHFYKKNKNETSQKQQLNTFKGRRRRERERSMLSLSVCVRESSAYCGVVECGVLFEFSLGWEEECTHHLWYLVSKQSLWRPLVVVVVMWRYHEKKKWSCVVWQMLKGDDGDRYRWRITSDPLVQRKRRTGSLLPFLLGWPMPFKDIKHQERRWGELSCCCCALPTLPFLSFFLDSLFFSSHTHIRHHCTAHRLVVIFIIVIVIMRRRRKKLSSSSSCGLFVLTLFISLTSTVQGLAFSIMGGLAFSHHLPSTIIHASHHWKPPLATGKIQCEVSSINVEQLHDGVGLSPDEVRQHIEKEKIE